MSVAAIAKQPLTTALRLDFSRVEAGVPLTTLTTFSTSSGIAMKDLYEIVIPARTLKHRRDRREHLTRDESDKLARVARIFDHAVKVFDGVDRARLWLQEPKRRFDGRSPLGMLQTETGARLVEEFLVQIDYGMFA